MRRVRAPGSSGGMFAVRKDEAIARSVHDPRLVAAQEWNLTAKLPSGGFCFNRGATTLHYSTGL